ncbi:MAG: hypothetical protein ACXWQO_14520 [Bdellovibrionota bacterium]
MSKFILVNLSLLLAVSGLASAAETGQVSDPAKAQLQEQGELINKLGNSSNPNSQPSSVNAKILRRQERADHRALRRKTNHRKHYDEEKN